MCAIVDNNVRHEVFGDPTPAGREFRKWIESGRGRLVVGGELKRELSEYGNFKVWLDEFWRSGVVEFSDDMVVDKKTEALKNDTSLHFDSNDQHVIALALVSGARLLYSKDQKLQQDFGEKQLIDNPRGRVYSNTSHDHLLKRKDLCKRSQ